MHCGDVITLSETDSSFVEPNGTLWAETVFENDNLIIFDKPPYMPVHPSILHQDDTLANYFARLYPELTFRCINRLDSGTTGLCAVAKNAYTANALQGKIRKIYYAVCEGVCPPHGTVDAPIARVEDSIILRHVHENGQRAVTHFQRIDLNSTHSIVKVWLDTGRTHQIRVHFAYIGHPLAGDTMYGGSKDYIGHQALHCGELTFDEPLTGESITVKSPMHEDVFRLGSVEESLIDMRKRDFNE